MFRIPMKAGRERMGTLGWPGGVFNHKGAPREARRRTEGGELFERVFLYICSGSMLRYEPPEKGLFFVEGAFFACVVVNP